MITVKRKIGDQYAGILNQDDTFELDGHYFIIPHQSIKVIISIDPGAVICVDLDTNMLVAVAESQLVHVVELETEEQQDE